jgi:hypothetical protein
VPECAALCARGELDVTGEVEIVPAARLAEAIAALRAGRRERLAVVTPG